MQPNIIISSSDEERFWSQVDCSGGPDSCWPWLGGCMRGYGYFRTYGKTSLAHIYAWYFTYGEWPTQNVLHHCDNPPCCNPKCLFQGTHLENMQDMSKKGRAPRGERSGMAKLTESNIRKIHRLYAKGWTQTRIAKHFGVHSGTVSRIVRGERWAHIVS